MFYRSKRVLALGIATLSFDPSVIDIAQFKALNPGSEPERYQGPKDSVLLLREEKLPEAKARKELSNRLAQFRRLYAPQSASYPGMITKDAGCAKEARLPSKTDETPRELRWFAEMPATQALVYGTCGSIDEPFLSQVLLVYCKCGRSEGALLEARLFRKKGPGITFLEKPIARCPD